MLDLTLNFSELERLRRFLAGKLEKHAVSLDYYYSPEFAGFYHKHEKDKQKMSKSSTSTCVVSLVRTGKWTGGRWSEKASETRKIFLTDEWQSAGLPPDNPFTVSFVLEAVTALNNFVATPLDGTLEARLSLAEKILSDAIRAGSVSLQNYPASAYLTQLVTRVLEQRNLLDPAVRLKIVDWAWKEIDHQLTLVRASSKTADLFQLAYSIVLVSEVGDPGEATPDQSLTLITALDIFFEHQLKDGSWPRSRPLFHYPGVGSAYCYEYELLVQMLQSKNLQGRLLKYLSKFGLSAFALEDTQYSLPNGGLGWTSGHHPQLKGPESWSTASAFHFAHNLERLVAEGMRRVVFEELDVVYNSPGQPKSGIGAFATKFLDCPLRYNEETLSLRETLFNRFLSPIANDAKNIEDGRSMSRATPMSAIFFGPPGTSKTELTKEIAEFLNWPRLTVDPSYFVKDGMDKIQAQADRLFSMLAASERIVVLLDEFDEMVRDRARSDDVLSRFLTTAMLPKLATINRSRRLVFIVATNFIENFDIAIARSGRFDLIVQVMPPTAAAKLEKWPDVSTKLHDLGLEAHQHVKAVLDDLTFDEFSYFAKVAMSAENKDAFIRIADEFLARSTLRSNRGVVGDGPATWEDASKEQEKKIRLPPVI